jgi:hypothetical protein
MHAISILVAMSFAKIINHRSSRTAIVHSTWSRMTQVREFVRFVQSASKVELNNLSHIPNAHFVVGGACILFIPAIPDEFVCCGCAGNPAFQHRLP